MAKKRLIPLVLLALSKLALAVSGSPVIYSTHGGSPSAQLLPSQLCFLDNTCMTTALSTPVSAANGGFGESMSVQTYSGGDTTTLPNGNIRVTTNLVNVRGIVAGTFDGQLTYVLNASSQTLFFINQYSGATAANRIICPGSAFSVNTEPNSLTVLRYDTTQSRWILVQTGTVRAAANPMQLSGGLISILQSGSSQAGYLSNADWNTFYNRIQALGTPSLYSVPYFGQTSPPGLVTIPEFTFDNAYKQLGVGVSHSDLAATFHGKSDTAQTIADITGSALTPIQVTLATNVTSVTITQTTPDIQRVYDVGTTTTNLGSGNYNAGDVVDYRIISGYDDTVNPIVWGVATTEVLGITDGANTFDVYVNFSTNSQNFPTNTYAIIRQVNGGGYNDGQIVTGPFTDTNSGWGSIPDTSNVADDFLANNTNYNGQQDTYGTSVVNSVTLFSATAYNPNFTDDNSGNAYKMQVTINDGSSPWVMQWPGARHYEGITTTFVSGPIGSSISGGSPTTPTTYGTQATGFHGFNADFYNYKTSFGIYSQNPDHTTWTDPNDGQYYYFTLAPGAFLDAWKVVIDSPNSAKLSTASSEIFDGTNFTDSTTVTPNVSYAPAINLSAHGTEADGLPFGVFQALESSSPQILFNFIDSTGTNIGRLKANNSLIGLSRGGGQFYITNNGAVSFTAASGQPFNVFATTGNIISGSTDRIFWDSAGGNLVGPDGNARLNWNATGGSLTNTSSLSSLNWTDAGGSLAVSGTIKASWSSSGLKVGSSGTSIGAVYSASATLDFPSVSAGGGVQDLTITVTGASVGDVVSLGLPSTVDAGIVYAAWVSASNTVTVRATNTGNGGSINPASATFRVMVTHF